MITSAAAAVVAANLTRQLYQVGQHFRLLDGHVATGKNKIVSSEEGTVAQVCVGDGRVEKQAEITNRAGKVEDKLRYVKEFRLKKHDTHDLKLFQTF